MYLTSAEDLDITRDEVSMRGAIVNDVSVSRGCSGHPSDIWTKFESTLFGRSTLGLNN